MAIVAIFGLVLMPNNVKAVSYKDYFTIDGFGKDYGQLFVGKCGRYLWITAKSDVITLTNPDGGDTTPKQLKVNYLIENEKGEFYVYSSNNFCGYDGDGEYSSFTPSDGG